MCRRVEEEPEEVDRHDVGSSFTQPHPSRNKAWPMSPLSGRQGSCRLEGESDSCSCVLRPGSASEDLSGLPAFASHFTDEKTEARRKESASPCRCCWETGEPCDPRQQKIKDLGEVLMLAMKGHG